MRSRRSSLVGDRSRRSSMTADTPLPTAADIAVPIELSLPHCSSAASSANNSQVDLTGHHIYLPDHAAGSSSQGRLYQLSQVAPHEPVTGGVIKDTKTGKHYAKRPVTKPAYSLGHTTGAPVVAAQLNRSTGRIGLGHAFPTEEQTRQYKAEKAARKSNNGSGTRSPSIVGSAGAHRASMDVNTMEGRTQLFSQLRELIHEEFAKANRGQTEELRKHVQQANLEQRQHFEDHIEDVKEIIATEPPQTTQSQEEIRSEQDVSEKAKETGTAATDITTLDSDQKPEYGRKGSEGTLFVDQHGEVVKDPEPVERGYSPDEESDDADFAFPNRWAAIRYKFREPFAEFLGCFMLMVFGNGINCQVTLSALYDPTAPKGDYLSISFGWGVGVAMGVWVAGGISGGMINPAVTIALAIFRKFPWKKVPVYIVAQILGCLVGSLCVYGLYVNPIRIVDPGQTETTAALFTTYPAEFLRQPSTRMSSFYNEFFASAILLIVILAIGDSSNTPPPDGLAPLVLLWLVWGLGACLGWQTAYAVNPARDLGPRLMLYIVGYSPDLLWTFNAWYWLWTPIIAVCSGAIMGCLIYDGLIYTGGDSPLNKKSKKGAAALGPGSKDKMPAAISPA
ncbi:Major intrinsic protein [Kalmanozyma brasiliensis GHG001]|uniref:Aquaporin n=1 Tax=Kalmanozyma brasiliensis (strain GHG001) TaxID=1365824 RepID=V5EWV0_KALBG|nr:Major intrinsic protein [Kalmanozyma brasiliensis GHG001]EST07878.1 Major intrinsic protein [Kalmanozyma brasiliensis GHG001]